MCVDIHTEGRAESGDLESVMCVDIHTEGRAEQSLESVMCVDIHTEGRAEPGECHVCGYPYRGQRISIQRAEDIHTEGRGYPYGRQSRACTVSVCGYSYRGQSKAWRVSCVWISVQRAEQSLESGVCVCTCANISEDRAYQQQHILSEKEKT